MAETPKHEITAYGDLKEAIKKNAIAETQATHDTTFEMNSLEDWYYEKQELISHISHAELQELKKAIEDSDQVLNTNKLSVTAGGEIKYEEQNVGKNETGKPESTEGNTDATIITGKKEAIDKVVNKIFENLKKIPVIGALIQLFEKFKNHNNATTEVSKDGEQITDNTLEEISQTDTQKDIYNTLLTEASAIDALSDDDTNKSSQKETLQKTCQEKISIFYKSENSTELGTLIERQKTFTDKIHELDSKINASETTTEEKTLFESQKAYTEAQKISFDTGLDALKSKTIPGATATETVKNTQSYEKEAKMLLEIPLDTGEHMERLDQAHITSGNKVTELIDLYNNKTSGDNPERKYSLYKELGNNIITLKAGLTAYKTAKEGYDGGVVSTDFSTKLSQQYETIKSRHNALLAKANTIQKDYKENYGPVDPTSEGIYVYNTVNGKIYQRIPTSSKLIKLYKGTDNALHNKILSNRISLDTSVQDGNYFAVPKDVIDTLIKEDSPDIAQSNWNLTIAKEAISDKLRKLEFNGYNLEKTPETTETTPEATLETTETTSET